MSAGWKPSKRENKKVVWLIVGSVKLNSITRATEYLAPPSVLTKTNIEQGELDRVSVKRASGRNAHWRSVPFVIAGIVVFLLGMVRATSCVRIAILKYIQLRSPVSVINAVI
jgi:hypothetical protein